MCRERFARYRGLKSFRESAWDPKENLPIAYSQIFQFANLQQTQAKINANKLETNADQESFTEEFKDEEMKHTSSNIHGEENGRVYCDGSSRITIWLSDVSVDTASSLLSLPGPHLVFSLHEHEHKVSILHFLISRHDQMAAEPIQCKEELEFHVAFRRFVARPIFSSDTAGITGNGAEANGKCLVERFAHPGRFLVASCYARIQFLPATLLLFKPRAVVGEAGVGAVEGVWNPLVASGSLISINPDRLLIKRII